MKRTETMPADMQREDRKSARNDPPNPWQTVGGGEVFDCPYFRVRSDLVRHGGRPERTYTSIRFKNAGVTVVPIDREGCTTLVGQHRYVFNSFAWEVPGGAADLNAPTESARSELQEETGYVADHWLHILSTAASPANSDERSNGFVAWGLHQGPAQPEAEELIVPRRLPFSEAVGLVLSGKIVHAASGALLLAIEARWRRRELPDDLMELLALGY
jgi:8-oxo-dGTP pyrophosphatase MutT (NUDIX family)